MTASPSATDRMAWTSSAGKTSLRMNPLAPRRSAPKAYSSRSKVVRIRMRVATVRPGVVTGFLGPKGSGKSTNARPAREIETIALALVAMTLFIAGCSLAVSVGGGLMERRRPFTLLRVTGVQLHILNRVMLLETVLPLTLIAVIAAAGPQLPPSSGLSDQSRIAHPARPCLLPDPRLRSSRLDRGAHGHVAAAQTHHRSRGDAIRMNPSAA